MCDVLTTRQIGAVRSRVSPEAMAVLLRYDWPGNVRELANVIERAQILAENHLITVDDLPENLVAVPSFAGADDISPPNEPFQVRPRPDKPATKSSRSLPLSLDEVERLHVVEALRQLNGNKVQSAKALGISRRALYRLIAKHRLEDFSPQSTVEAP